MRQSEKENGSKDVSTTRLFIEALLVDEELADQVWELWNVGEISEDLAAWAWCILAESDCQYTFS